MGSPCSASPVSEPNAHQNQRKLIFFVTNSSSDRIIFFHSSKSEIYSQLTIKNGKCRQNYHEECEAAINKQINMELFASYSYTALSSHFSRDDVSLQGFAKFFKDSSNEERDHAEKFMKYQALRGGRVVLQAINRPAADEWDSPLAAMEYVLKLEKEVNQPLLEIHALASNHSDPHLSKFLEDDFLDEQAESIHQIANYITKLTRVGDGLGVHLFDKELQ